MKRVRLHSRTICVLGFGVLIGIFGPSGLHWLYSQISDDLVPPTKEEVRLLANDNENFVVVHDRIRRAREVTFIGQHLDSGGNTTAHITWEWLPKPTTGVSEQGQSEVVLLYDDATKRWVIERVQAPDGTWSDRLVPITRTSQ